LTAISHELTLRKINLGLFAIASRVLSGAAGRLRLISRRFYSETAGQKHLPMITSNCFDRAHHTILRLQAITLESASSFNLLALDGIPLHDGRDRRWLNACRNAEQRPHGSASPDVVQGDSGKGYGRINLSLGAAIVVHVEMTWPALLGVCQRACECVSAMDAVGNFDRGVVQYVLAAKALCPRSVRSSIRWTALTDRWPSCRMTRVALRKACFSLGGTLRPVLSCAAGVAGNGRCWISLSHRRERCR